MALNIHDLVEHEREVAIPRPDLVKEYRRYAEGEHDLLLSTEQRVYAGRLCDHATIDNACDLVLTTAASRLEFVGYRVPAPAVQTYLDEFTTKNGLHDLQYDVHYRTLRDGDHYLALSWTPERQADRVPVLADVAIDVPFAVSNGGIADLATATAIVPSAALAPAPGGRVSVHHEPAWDGETGMFVGYDVQGNPAYAVKDFVQLFGDPPKPRNRRVIYFPDHIERYLQEGAGWVPFTLPGEDPGARGSVPWTKRDGRPLGLPVVHFAHGRFGRAPYGASDLSGILGLQDHLNAALLDLAASAQLTAFPMLKVRGIDPADRKLLVGPGRVLGSSNPDSDVSMMVPGDLSQLESYHQRLLGVIARDTATPEHLIGAGAWPSGIAIQRADSPQIAKVKRLATTVGPAWATVGHRATEIANAFGGLALDEDSLIAAVFAPPEQLDPESQATFAKLSAEAYATLSTIDDPTLMVKTGLVTSDEAAQIVADRTATAAALPPVAAF